MEATADVAASSHPRQAALESEAPFDPTSRPPRKLVVEAALRALATTALLVALYFVLPLDRGTDVTALAVIAIGCAVLGVGIGWQIRRIARSEHPNLRAAEALAFTIPVFVVLFATTYYLMALATSTSFTEQLTRTDALYLSVTILTTTGFGDISAKSEAARLVVTFQMLLDLLLLGLVVRLFLNAVNAGQQRQVERHAT